MKGLFLAVCWIPNQFVYLLSKFNITQLDTPLHHATVVLAMFNSCVNPWIYGAANRNYRRKFIKILCFLKKVHVAPEETDITVRERGTRSSRNAVRFGKTEQQTEGSRSMDCSVRVHEASQVKPVYRQVESKKMVGISKEDTENQLREETVDATFTNSSI